MYMHTKIHPYILSLSLSHTRTHAENSDDGDDLAIEAAHGDAHAVPTIGKATGAVCAVCVCVRACVRVYMTYDI